MAVSFSPEFRLAAACAMWPPSDRRTEAIKAAATRPLDWTRFLRVARRHGVVGLVRDGLATATFDRVVVGGHTTKVVRLRITNAGMLALMG